MRKLYKLVIMRIIFTLLTGLFFSIQSFSQSDITIGTGTVGNISTGYPCPLQDRYEGSRAQFLYLASELTAAGMTTGNISAIKYNVTALNGAGLIELLNVKIGTTTVGSLGTTTWETVTTTVIAPFNYQPVAGINTLTFATPFFWNGTDNLIIEICNGEPGNGTGTWFTNNPTVPWTTGLAFNGSHTYRADNVGNSCATTVTTNTGTQTTRPNIVFSWTPANTCSGVPNGGTTVANPSTVCLGQSFSLTVTGSTVASGITYQWESSTDNITYAPVSGATSSSLTTTQAATTWYRRITTCTNAGGGSAPSTPVQVTSPALVQGTFTINSAQPTGGTNFISYNAAYDYIKCGINGPVIFNVVPGSGPYTEQLSMIAVPGASATNTVTFNGNGTTLQFLSTNTNERAVIKLNNTDHMRFDSLNITALGTTTTEYGFGVQLINNADSNIFRNCRININTTSTSTNYAGIVMSSSNTSATTAGTTICDDNTFDNNTITGGYYGITMVGSTSVAVQRNKVTRNKFRDQYLYGIYLLGNFDAQIESNDITKAVTTISPTLGYGIFVTSLNTKVNISKNKIHDIFNAQPATTNDFYAIYHTSVDALATLENIVVNNAIYDIKGNGTIYGIYNSSSDNIWYYHNTVALDDATSTATEATRGFFQTLTSGGIEFRNNMVTIRRGGTGTKHCIYMGTTATQYISNNNNLLIGSGATNFTGFNGTNQATLVNWQTATSQDANSTAANPLYANALAGLLQPTSASVNDLGANLTANLTVATDIQNAARTIATPDMGAWEFTPGACVAPPEAGTSTTNIVGPVCPNTLGNFDLTANSIGLGQTYEWEFSTNMAGPYVSISTILTTPSFNYNIVQTGYFRCVVTCNQLSANSVPVLITVNSALPGGTYTINSALPTGGTNFQTFNSAYQAMKCGITGPIVMNVVAGSGPYNEQLLMDPIAGTSAINTITWNGNGNVIAFISTNTNERGVIRLNGNRHMIFDSLTVNTNGTTTTEFGHGFHLRNDADSNIIRKCTINMSLATTSANYAGIVLSGGTTAIATGTNRCDFNTIEGNTIKGGFYSISVAGSGTDRTNNNIIRNNILEDAYTYGVYVSNTDNTLIEKNKVSRPLRTVTTTAYGIYATGITNRLKVSKNSVFNPFGAAPASTSAYYGIYHTGTDAAAAQPNEVSNNIVYNFNGAGTLYGIYNTSSDNVNYYHNTIDISDATNASTNSTYGFYQTTQATGIDIQNNVFTITRAGSGTRFGLYFVSGTTNYTSDHNNIYVPGINGFTGFDGTNEVTLADWQADTGEDAASVATNPFYQSANTGNLEPISPILNDKGTNVGITSDIRDAARSVTTPDPGAFEFAVPPCTAPPVVSTAIATPNSGICIGALIQLRISGIIYSSGQTYQWQTATSAAGPYTNISGVMLFPDTAVLATSTLYYRCVVTCQGVSTNSNAALVTLNPAFLAGTYTINSTLPASATNFTSFNTAVAALYCGITGHVIFNVAPGTYTEQVRVGNVPGTGPSATVTFQSDNGAASSAILTFNSTAAAANYTLRLDSSKYFIFNALTISATNTTNGRAIELSNTITDDTIKNCIINAPVATASSTNLVGIYSNSLRGNTKLLLFKNTINGGSSGIYITAQNATNKSINNIIDSNSINGSYQYNMYLQNLDFVKVRGNSMSITSPRVATTYGLYMINNDSAISVSGNTVNISGLTGGTFYGMYFTTNRSSVASRGNVSSNIVLADTLNTGAGYGIYQTNGINQQFLNNTVSINTSSATAYGLYHTNGTVNYYNNSVNNTSPATGTTNIAAYLSQTAIGSGQSRAINNIFAHNGGGRSIFMSNANFVYSDYNMLYTSGTVLGTFNAAAINNLRRWIDTTGWDYHSITYKPAFISNTNLKPDVASPDVWAIHGRGNQLAGNNTDFNGNSRPVTVQTGVPDLGAYEFVPTSVPVALVATPAAPAPNTTQKFSLGTDTVSVIKWGASVPATITGKRFTGTIPPGLTPAQRYMYFYTEYDVPAGSYNYEMQQAYMDPWLGIIPVENQLKMGRTDNAGVWLTGTTSVTSTFDNVIRESGLSFIGKYTGLTDGVAPPPVIDPIVLDTASFGRRFWVGYGHHQFFGTSNTQQMVLYLGARQTSANVTVRVNGTPWVKNYTIPANTVITSDIITKSGLFDARVLAEGMNDRGISINSDEPIVAYAHIYGSASSGATMLLPVGTYGYEYYATGFRQNYAADCFAWFYMIADRDSTFIEVTPANRTLAGRPANVPFVVQLNKGEIYQVLGAINSGSNGFDLTGSKVVSIPNNQGKCLPFAMFSGSSRTTIYCNGTNSTGNGDNLIQQNFPSQAWGKKYLTAPTSNSSAANSLHTNIVRVVVKDTATIVSRNGLTLPVGSLINNRYYEFDSNTADYIESDKPVMVAMYMASSGSNCANTTGNGDPEMIYLSPLEQGIKNVALFRNTREAITVNYVTLIIPTAGLTSLQIGGSNVFDYTYPHTNLTGYTVVVKRWTAAQAQTVITSDSAFTAITYGLGNVESYGYNAGTLVKNLNAVTSINNVLSSGTSSPYTCQGTPFRFNVLLSVKPSLLTWQFSQVPGLTPGTDITQSNPVPVDSTLINGVWFYRYTVAQDYIYNGVGTFNVPVSLVHPSIESCNSSLDVTVTVTVLPEPLTDFAGNFNVCTNEPVQLNGIATPNGTATVSSWSWDFGNTATAAIQNPVTQYTTPGTYNINLKIVGTDGCLGDTTKTIVVNPRPVMVARPDTSVCTGVTLPVIRFNSNIASAVYNWTNSNTSIGLAASGSGDLPSFVAANTSGVPQIASIIVIPAFINGQANCEGVADTFTITVNPVPAMNAVNGQAYCHNTSTTPFNFSSNVAGTVFSWTNSNPSIGLPASGTGNISAFTATNTSANPVIATITVTPRFGTGPTACTGTPVTFTITVNPLPPVALVSDSLAICLNTNAVFAVQNPIAGVTYNWYNAPTGGTLLGTGTSYTVTNVTTTTIVYVEGVQNGCPSAARRRGIVTVLPLLTAPVAVVDSVGVNSITFGWNAVPNALSYSVSTNNGATWQTPSSGATGLQHRVTGLAPLTTVTLIVRANGGCQDAVSAPVSGKTLTDQIYFPNSFTPNGDGKNETWQVYGYIIKDLRMMIFNQWGEKIFESRNQSRGWDGTYKGKKQPSGVYMYVVELVLNDGSKQTYKGSINLIQ
jgi:trimeric autotransporter adhesin